MARPTKRTRAVEDELIERITCGEHLKSICSDAHMPSASTILRWEAHDKAFCELLAHARRVGAHMLVGESRDIVDDGRNDWMEKHGRDGSVTGWVVNGEAVQRSRLRAEQRWKEAQALSPREFAPKHQVEHSGSVAVTGEDSAQIVANILELLATGRVKLPGGVQLEEFDEPDEDDFSDLAAPAGDDIA